MALHQCQLVRFVLALTLLPAGADAQPVAPTPADGWLRVDSLAPGTTIIVAGKSGEKLIGDFRRATPDDVTITTRLKGSRGQVSDLTLPKSLIATVATHDPVRDGIGRGALAGAGGLVALLLLSNESCGIGCENDMPTAMTLVAGAVGAGVGSLVGLLADRDAARSEILFPPSLASDRPPRRSSRFVPTWPSVRIGPTLSQTTFVSSSVKGRAAAPGFAVAIQFSPHLSAHVEYTSGGEFLPAPGSVPDEVAQNLIVATTRAAGLPRGIESRRISYAFSELVGVRPSSWGRLSVEFVAGLGVQGLEKRNYYDAYRETGQGTARRIEQVPGKFYVLNFETPEVGLVLGLDAEIAIVRGLAVVPTLRYNRMGDPGPSIAYGVGAQWRF
jgi:hypothetical protein